MFDPSQLQVTPAVVQKLIMEIAQNGVDGVDPQILPMIYSDLDKLEEAFLTVPMPDDKKLIGLEIVQLGRDIMSQKLNPFDAMHQMVEIFRQIGEGKRRRFTYADTLH